MDDDVFDSVTWETPSPRAFDALSDNDHEAETSTGPGYRQEGGLPPQGNDEPKWEGYLQIQVSDPIKELEGTKDTYISYLVSGKVHLGLSYGAVVALTMGLETNLSTFTSTTPSARRRFQDFVFLRENLSKDFPACVVPPLPGKHRLGELQCSCTVLPNF